MNTLAVFEVIDPYQNASLKLFFQGEMNKVLDYLLKSTEGLLAF